MSLNDFACSMDALRMPLLEPKSKPLFSAICFVCWLILPSTMKGDLPLRVLTLTTPLERSPYSTEGIPVTISTDSIFELLMLRVGAPAVSPTAALLSRRMPSTSMAVPNEALPPSCIPLRSAMRVSFISVAFTVLPPGNSVDRSLTLTICWLSRAVRSMV